MKHPPRQMTALVLIFAVFFCTAGRAQFLDQIGLTTLRAVTTNLDGTGVMVGQAEASAPNFEVNPGVVGQPTNLFTWIAQTIPPEPTNTSDYFPPPLTANTFTNSLGVDYYHADNVGNDFYGIPNGVATNVAHVNNYDAGTFVYHYVGYDNPITEHIVNQSFTFQTYDSGEDQVYDNYAAQHGVLFVSGAGFNNSPVWSPATCYNGIGVGVFNNAGSPFGPTPDGRSKPDITASGVQDTVTSYSTALVSGAAALLMQAGLRGDGGDTNSAVDIRTLKALLLNGAVKPADWTNTPSAPLHPRYGAGVLNVFNSYEQLAGGKHGYIASTTVAAGGAHPPNGATGTVVGVLSGWDFNTNTSSSFPSAQDGVKHYFFNVTNSTSSAAFTATVTLVWNRQQNQAGINNLDLYLYDAASSNLVMCSTSTVDNVEHVFVPRLPQGRYDLQVLMNASGINPVNNSETYALAWEFFSMPLNIAPAGTNVALAWPVYPAGFVVESTTNLNSPSVWSTNNLPPPSVTNQQNYLLLNATNANQFFRLRRPNF